MAAGSSNLTCLGWRVVTRLVFSVVLNDLILGMSIFRGELMLKLDKEILRRQVKTLKKPGHLSCDPSNGHNTKNSCAMTLVKITPNLILLFSTLNKTTPLAHKS